MFYEDMSLPIPIPMPTPSEIISFFKRPKLLAFIPKDEPKVQALIDNRRRAFYHLGVKNVSSVPIKNARIYLNFEGVGILVKWDWKPEPFDSYATPLKIVPWLLVDSQVHDILPAIEETFGILIKYEGEDEIYPFNPFSYLYLDLKDPQRKLDKDEYVFKANLVSENYRCSFSFKVRNNGKDFSDVSIEPLREYEGDKTFKPIKWV